MSSPPTGGFFKTQVLSPPPSSVHSSQLSRALPHPRSRPLKSGSSKEAAVIRHIDGGIQQIQRRFAKRLSQEDAVEHLDGYKSFREAGKDIESLVDVVWVSGTPNLQVPYLMSLALLAVDCISGFPAAPRTMFQLLHKLDIVFASLLQGRDFETSEPLPGFTGGRNITDTEKVRLKSLVERTRVVVVNVLAAGEREEETGDETGETTEDQGITTEGMTDTESEDVDHMDVDTVSWDMEAAKVYDRTVVELGDTIGGTPIGIVTDD